MTSVLRCLSCFSGVAREYCSGPLREGYEAKYFHLVAAISSSAGIVTAIRAGRPMDCASISCNPRRVFPYTQRPGGHCEPPERR